MRNEYPRPQFVREKWVNLNGQWQFDFDYEAIGTRKQWFNPEVKLTQTINVPFVYQADISDFADSKPSEVVWYKRELVLEKLTPVTVLHFGAVDYQADVYVNGHYVGQHIGGHTSFSFDISNFVVTGTNDITVKVTDYITTEWIPRGKQYWKPKSESIWYTNTTGMWQSVWLEQLEERYLKRVRLIPNLDHQTIEIIPEFNQVETGMKLRTLITFNGEMVVDAVVGVTHNCLAMSYEVLGQKIMHSAAHGPGRTWSPDHPNLFDVQFELLVDDVVVDRVTSYFGMRKIHVEAGVIFLNNRPFYQKLVLDQGYWPKTLMTAPSDQAFIDDIKLSKAMGFNGCRKHQKVEDPRFFYHADKLGFLVWGESASPANYQPQTVGLVIREWEEIIDRDGNHPSIIVWTPANESWGISDVNHSREQQHFMQALYHYVKSQDTTRLVVVNDGWEMLETDLIGIHNYNHGNQNETKKYARYQANLATTEQLLSSLHAGRQVMAGGYPYQNQPILLTEFGGIAYSAGQSADDAWGYTSTDTEEEFIADYQRLMDAIDKSEALHGFCYTQLTDVEQETNGLLTYDRQIKIPLEAIREMNDQIGY